MAMPNLATLLTKPTMTSARAFFSEATEGNRKMMTSQKQVSCIGCGILVPDTDGATHAYLGVSAGCWELFGDVSAREYSDVRLGAVRNLSVDSYTLQHPGVEERRTIQSAAVHLISLYFQLEKGVDSIQSMRIKQSATDHTDHFFWLEPPPIGPITVADVYKTTTTEEHLAMVKAWAHSVWQEWAPHHATLLKWVDLVF